MYCFKCKKEQEEKEIMRSEGGVTRPLYIVGGS